MLYTLLQKLLFQLDAEQAHHISLEGLSGLSRMGLLPAASIIDDPFEACGIRWPNRVGLAAGLDKNGDYIEALARLGFGALELGTVTPRPQPGNPKPRLFRLEHSEAIINRMGFNNKGVDHLLKQVQRAKYEGVLGINLGKNADTPMNMATEDYLIGLRKVFTSADYVTINISSPNTKNLRELQSGDAISLLLEKVKNEQIALSQKHQRHVPLFLKIAPDLSDESISEIAEKLLTYEIEGVITTNTTLSRAGLHDDKFANEAGGLSGKPLTEMATNVTKRLHEVVGDRVFIIGSGGVMTAENAFEKSKAGASFVQLYSGLIYAGPKLISETAVTLKQRGVFRDKQH